MATQCKYPMWVRDATGLMETDALKAFIATSPWVSEHTLEDSWDSTVLKEEGVTLEWEWEDTSQRFQSWLCHSLAVGFWVSQSLLIFGSLSSIKWKYQGEGWGRWGAWRTATIWWILQIPGRVACLFFFGRASLYQAPLHPMIPGKWAENRPLPPSEAQCWLRVTKQLVQGHTSNEKQQSYTQIVLTLEPGFSFTLLFFPSFQLGICCFCSCQGAKRKQSLQQPVWCPESS